MTYGTKASITTIWGWLMNQRKQAYKIVANKDYLVLSNTGLQITKLITMIIFIYSPAPFISNYCHMLLQILILHIILHPYYLGHLQPIFFSPKKLLKAQTFHSFNRCILGLLCTRLNQNCNRINKY